MSKTIKEVEQYIAPLCEEHFLILQRTLLGTSIDEYNPGAYVPGMTDGGEI